MNIFRKYWLRLRTQTLEELYYEGADQAIQSVPAGPRRGIIIGQVLPHGIEGDLTNEQEHELLNVVDAYLQNVAKGLTIY